MTYRKTRIAVQYDGADRSWQSAFTRRVVLSTGLVGLTGLTVFGADPVRAAMPDTPLSFLAKVRAVEDGQTLLLEDGRRLRLPHILPPGPDRHAPMAETAPIRRAAQGLADLVLGRQIRIDLADPGLDRYGRLRGWARLEGTDIAEALCRAGWTRVFPEPGAERVRIDPLIAAEDQARASQVGFWGEGVFNAALANPYDGARDRFEIVTGQVTEVAEIGRRWHLGFGADWREDFTAGLPKRTARALAKQGLDLSALQGQRVEVRGWVRFWNGPFLELTEPASIRLR